MYATATVFVLRQPEAVEDPLTTVLRKSARRLLAEPWNHTRTATPIASIFVTIGHRTVRSKDALSRKAVRLIIFKLVMAAVKSWRRFKGETVVSMLIDGVTFTD